MRERPPYLFSDSRLDEYLAGRRDALEREIASLPSEQLSEVDISAWAEALAAHHAVDVPAVDRNGVWLDKPEETKVDVRYHSPQTRAISDMGQPAWFDGFRTAIHLPFHGDGQLFSMRASTMATAMPVGVVRAGEIVHPIEYPVDAVPDLEHLVRSFCDRVEQWVTFTQSDIRRFNGSLASEAGRLAQARKRKLDEHEAGLTKTGLTFGRPSADSRTVLVEAVVRRPSPVLPSAVSRPVKLEPALSNEVFEHILGVIHDQATMMERAPSTYAAMSEEQRRDVIVGALHTHYRGKVSEEAFNVRGKTDLIVRHENDNLFIGECKVWTGAKGFAAALDQLLSYSAWMDSKLALIIFVEVRGLTKVLTSGEAALKGHAAVSEVRAGDDAKELRARVRWPGDDDRLADLAVRFVHTPAKGDKSDL